MKNGVMLKVAAKRYYYPGGEGENLSGAFTRAAKRRAYLVSKRAADVLISLACLPLLLGICCVLLCLNPFWNPGRLFFLQQRCGRSRQGFTMIKFRTMTRSGAGCRGADDPLETSRITPLGHWMRDTKLDELPQILNVLMGQMSLIGPRPEILSFAETYRQAIPGYGIRETVKPGMSGYAQVTQGYTDCIEMAREKLELDAHYVRNMGWRLDLFVLVATIKIVFGWPPRL
ncbi:sugar transferase [Leisingera aquaemixtae]|uniref:UDP-glucose:undecaprenyl-phosphate glucose-1-phosphate transferase n=2 Tax=Leisingera aquaemixtae TaxID=1396826 RepID=A0A0P1HTL7_9RHOB|nr:UDP-glucose:undecaprenyl-phosphate glucose-1-phosphate transferase [Leisingera aquaemixtae]